MLNRMCIIFVMVFIFSCSSSDSSLKIYTYRSFLSDWGPSQWLKNKFYQETGVKVDFVSLGDNARSLQAAIQRLNVAKKIKADLVLGLNNLVYQDLKDIFLNNQNLEFNFISFLLTENSHIFVPIGWSYISINYHGKQGSFVNDWMSLFSYSDDKNIIFLDPEYNDLGLGLLLWTYTLWGSEEIFIQNWKKLKNKTLAIYKNWDAAYYRYLKKNNSFMLGYSSSPYAQWTLEKDNTFHALNFKKGNPIILDTIAIFKTSDKKKLARMWIQFLLKFSVQEKLVQSNFMMSVLNDFPLNKDILQDKEFKKLVLTHLNVKDLNHIVKKWKDIFYAS